MHTGTGSHWARISKCYDLLMVLLRMFHDLKVEKYYFFYFFVVARRGECTKSSSYFLLDLTAWPTPLFLFSFMTQS